MLKPIAKSLNIRITSHNNGGWIRHLGSSDELQQESLSNIIANVNPRNVHNRKNVISTDHPCISNPTFDFYPKQDGMHFNNCTVNFDIQANTLPKKAVNL